MSINTCSFFFESVTWDEGEVGFEDVPGGSTYANRSIISWHFYIPPMVSRSLAVMLANHFHSMIQITHLEFSERQKDAKRLNCSSRYHRPKGEKHSMVS